MIFTSPLQRIDPPNVAAEKPALETCLDYHRATLLAKLEGLTQEQAGRRLVGSDTTLHGLIRHMTTIEQWWFVECVAGLKEPYAYYDGEEVDWDWDLSRSEGLRPTSTATSRCASATGGSPPTSTRAPPSPPSGAG